MYSGTETLYRFSYHESDHSITDGILLESINVLNLKTIATEQILWILLSTCETAASKTLYSNIHFYWGVIGLTFIQQYTGNSITLCLFSQVRDHEITVNYCHFRLKKVLLFLKSETVCITRWEMFVWKDWVHNYIQKRLFMVIFFNHLFPKALIRQDDKAEGCYIFSCFLSDPNIMTDLKLLHKLLNAMWLTYRATILKAFSSYNASCDPTPPQPHTHTPPTQHNMTTVLSEKSPSSSHYDCCLCHTFPTSLESNTNPSVSSKPVRAQRRGKVSADNLLSTGRGSIHAWSTRIKPCLLTKDVVCLFITCDNLSQPPAHTLKTFLKGGVSPKHTLRLLHLFLCAVTQQLKLPNLSLTAAQD